MHEHVWNVNVERTSGELGYGLVPEFRGLGLMREALLAITRHGFDAMKLGVLEAFTERSN